jgi:hypothetical protein
MWRRKMCDKFSIRDPHLSEHGRWRNDAKPEEISINDLILKQEEQSYGNEKEPVPKYNPDYMQFIREYIR